MKYVTLTIAVVVLTGCDFMGRRAEAEARMAVADMEAQVARLEQKLAEQREELTQQCDRRLAEVQVQASPGAGESEELAKLLRQAQGEAGKLAEQQAGAPAIACAKDRCTVPRALIDKWTADPIALAKQARVMPSMKDGEVTGFKLYGIRSTTEAAAVGLQNGDLVTALGGRTLRSMDGAMAAMTAMTAEREWVIEGERQGAPFKITIVVE